MRILVLTLLAAAVATPAGDPQGFGLWTSAELKGAGKRLAPKMNAGKVAADTLAKWDKHFMMISHREGDGESEWHQKHADIFIPQVGEATLVYGGQLAGAKDTGPGEKRGSGIQGGMTKKLAPGDIVHIPAGMPHQLLVKGKFTYAVFKVEQ